MSAPEQAPVPQERAAQARALRDAGLYYREIGAQLGISATRASQWARYGGWSLAESQRQRLQRVRELRAKGLTYEVIGSQIGRSKQQTGVYCRSGGWFAPSARVERICQECGESYPGPAGEHSMYCCRPCQRRSYARRLRARRWVAAVFVGLEVGG